MTKRERQLQELVDQQAEKGVTPESASNGLTVGSLFAGVGGLELGLERAGMRVLWQVENDDFCWRVLAKHWPGVTRYEDVHDVGAHNLETVDLICGGFPCQPVSQAGKKKAQDDERWLWPEFARIIRELRPRYALMENVPGLLVRGFGDVLGDLATLGYDAEWGCVSAASVGAPHLRQRVFVVAHAQGERREGSRANGQAPGVRRRLTDPGEEVAHTTGPRCHDRAPREGGPLRDEARGQKPQRLGGPVGGTQWSAEPDVGRVAHGVPSRVDRLRALGNAVVPQVSEYIGRRIMSAARNDSLSAGGGR